MKHGPDHAGWSGSRIALFTKIFMTKRACFLHGAALAMGVLLHGAAAAGYVVYTAVEPGYTADSASAAYLAAQGAPTEFISFDTDKDGGTPPFVFPFVGIVQGNVFSDSVAFHSTGVTTVGWTGTGPDSAITPDDAGLHSGTLTMTLAAPASAVGFGVAGGGAAVDFFDPEGVLVASLDTRDGFTFVGLVGTGGSTIGSITLEGGQTGIEDFQFLTAAADATSSVPEPDVRWLLGLGIVVAVLATVRPGKFIARMRRPSTSTPARSRRSRSDRRRPSRIETKMIERALSIGLAIIALCVTVDAAAQATVANGPYYATPSWDQSLPAASRFVVLANFNSDAVLDRETGLVWQRSPSTNVLGGQQTFMGAVALCNAQDIGGKFGWRLPAYTELLSLFELAGANFPHLPTGHPFLGVLSTSSDTALFWSATINPLNGGGHLELPVTDHGFVSNVAATDDNALSVWCVRGATTSP